MAGLALGYLFTTGSWHKSELSYEDTKGVTWDTAFKKVATVDSTSKRFLDQDRNQKELLDKLNLLSNELFEDRREMYVDHIESKFVKDIKKWIDFIHPVHQRMRIDFNKEAAKESAADGAEAEPEVEVTDAEGAEPTSGWVIEVKAHHFHNSDKAVVDVFAGKQFVRKTLIKNLLTKRDVTLPDHPGLEFTYSDLGVSHPTIVWVSEAPKKYR